MDEIKELIELEISKLRGRTGILFVTIKGLKMGY